MQQLRYALRTLGRAPVFTAAAVLTIGIAIGANTAIFSIADFTLLRGTPGVHDEQRLATVTVEGKMQSNVEIQLGVPYKAYLAYSQGASRALGVAGYAQADVNMSSANMSGAQRLHGEIVSDNYFALLGTSASLGRLVDPVIAKGAPASVTISHRLWQRAFAGDPAVAGKSVLLNGTRFTIAGVAEPNFEGVDPFSPADVWVPSSAAGLLDARRSQDDGFGRLLIRLRPGVTLADAQQEATRFLDAAKPNVSTFKITLVVRAREGVGMRGEQRREAVQTIWILVVGVALVLLIACANVANLFLARGATRRREVALRRSLGANNWALVSQVITESLVITVAGAALGIVLAFWATSLLEGYKVTQQLPAIPAVPIDARVIGFAVLVSMIAATSFSLPPVLGTLRADAASMLRNGDRAVTGRSRLQGALVIAQVAISFVLVVGAALFVRTVENLRAIDLGFRPENVIGMSLDLAAQGYTPATAGALVRQLEQRLRAVRSFSSVAIAERAPFAGMHFSHPRPVAGQPTVERQYIVVHQVSGGYFKTLGIPLVRGRAFTAGEVASGARVAIVSSGMAREFWPGRDPLGQLLVISQDTATVVGIVGDTRQLSPRLDVEPDYYTPFSEGTQATVFVRSTADHASVVSEVRRAVAALDRNLPTFDALALTERVDRNFVTEISTARLTSTFGIIGLVLALVGLYAVMSFTVAQRTRELAIRVALGAGEAHIRSHVLGDALRLLGVGLVLGGGAAYALAHVVTNRLYGVSGSNLVLYLVTAFVMVVVALGASYLPARRATRVDPMTTLRAD